MLFFFAGLLLWNESRVQWVGRGLSEKQSQQKQESRLKYVINCITFGTINYILSSQL
jgi:hypothetical protein